MLTADGTLVVFCACVQDGMSIQVFFSCEPLVTLIAFERSDVWFVYITHVHLETGFTIENLVAKFTPKA